MGRERQEGGGGAEEGEFDSGCWVDTSRDGRGAGSGACGARGNGSRLDTKLRGDSGAGGVQPRSLAGSSGRKACGGRGAEP